MKIVFLDAATMGDTDMSEIAALGNFVCYSSSTPELARARVADADVVLLNKIIVNKEFLDAAPKLRLICEAGTGINNIDVELCRERGVAVRNVAAYSTDSVAQIAWMHILNLAGNAFHYDKYIRSGEYSAGNIHVDAGHPFTELSGKTLGIVGMGAIGQKVASIAAALGMKVVYYSTSGTSHCQDYPSVSLDCLLMESDVISIHAPYNERTAGLIDYAGLCKMKPTAFLVNTGRGGIAVEEDIVRAINEQKIAGAGIDVYVKEPIPSDHPYLHCKYPQRLLLTPHIAWYSKEARQRLAQAMADNIRKGW
ncbi:MAG: hydroxyacid dehydrogenase [Bacteroidales bacterium]|nr:hydroxyacid dehydrogenase [Bacteroidales bacterium]